MDILAGYPLEAFRTLVKKGIAIGNRETDMKEVSLNRFKYLKDIEIKGLHAYLSSLAQNKPSSNMASE